MMCVPQVVAQNIIIRRQWLPSEPSLNNKALQLPDLIIFFGEDVGTLGLN